ncbi:MAG TPA: hypothetical protein VJG83_00480 [archaeon]|nr:hypothetical protein [archaeon]
MKGQISIEFLVLLAAFISFLSVFVGYFSELENASFFVLDVANAKGFISNIGSGVSALKLFGEGSEMEISALAQSEWEIIQKADMSYLRIYKKGKSVEVPIEYEIYFDKKKFSGKFSVILKKKNGKISVS